MPKKVPPLARVLKLARSGAPATKIAAAWKRYCVKAAKADRIAKSEKPKAEG
jgi:hypothetical protein